MAGGPVYPISAVPVTSGKVFPYIYEGDGSGSKYEEVMGVMASVDGDATWQLRFEMPPVLPSGTAKLRILALADAVSGVAKINPKWVSVAVEEDPSSATPVAEGTQTITWSTDDDDEYKELKVTLDADTIVAGEIVVMNLVFENASWTLAVLSGYRASIIWE